MAQNSIEIRGVGKAYRIGKKRDKDQTLFGSVAGFIRSPLENFRKLRSLSHFDDYDASDVIWAIKDVSFDVPDGQVVGIVGKNGAGKSTLLKVLSRITPPTTGRVKIRGRVGSLLEVGTGFHPDLTGRENTYLNGTILGMRRSEIAAKFDEITEFSGIEKFIDTPVKRYSSGMRVRLAFAVAAHLEPEVLIIDEVLAVGDVEFQQRCMGKMKEVAQHGRTVLFVSHNLGYVQVLCDRAVLLQHGTVVDDGTPPDVISNYLKDTSAAADQDIASRKDRSGLGNTLVTKIETSSEVSGGVLASGKSARIRIHYSNHLRNMDCLITVYDLLGQAVFYVSTGEKSDDDDRNGERGSFLCEIKELLLLPGRYRLNVALKANGELEDRIEGAATFQVEQGVIGGRPTGASGGYGSVSMPHSWTVPQT